MPSLFERFPRRGGNYNNTSNTGLGYVNANNTRSNTNTNYGVRSGSASSIHMTMRKRPVCKGGYGFPRSATEAKEPISVGR